MRLSTIVALLVVPLLLVPCPVTAQSTLNYTFEDKQLRGAGVSMHVKPQIVTEGDNTFMRITGSAVDKHAIPRSYPNRNRSTIEWTTHAPSMPLITDANRRQTYRADVRFHENTGSDGVVFELYQWGSSTGGYGTRDSKGPVVIFWRNGTEVGGRANYANETKWDKWDFGSIPAGSWHNFMVKAIWSHDPRQGRIDVYLDGKLKKTIQGRGTNLGPGANRLPNMKLGMYGDFAVGVIDVDNVSVGPTTAGGEPPNQIPRRRPGGRRNYRLSICLDRGGLIHMQEAPVDYFSARERRLVLALRVSEVLNSLVRPLLAIMFGGAIVWMAIIGAITSGEFLAIGAAVVGYFFSSRETEKAQTQIKQQQDQLVDLAKQLPPPPA